MIYSRCPAISGRAFPRCPGIFIRPCPVKALLEGVSINSGFDEAADQRKGEPESALRLQIPGVEGNDGDPGKSGVIQCFMEKADIVGCPARRPFGRV